jgi:hypothetical protein
MANLRFTGDAANVRSDAFIANARAALKLPGDARLEFVRASDDAQGGHTLVYSVGATVMLQGSEFGLANGVTVDDPLTATLVFDRRGELSSAQARADDPKHLALIKDQVRKLAAAGEIGSVPREKGPDGRAKPWYIETDAQGHRRLKRALIA